MGESNCNNYKKKTRPVSRPPALITNPFTKLAVLSMVSFFNAEIFGHKLVETDEISTLAN